jgi:biopolymer transport protein ExbB/TolQ
MTKSRPEPAEGVRRTSPTAVAFFVGLPLAAGVLALVHFGPLRHTAARRYVEHPVEWVEVAMFCCALGALLAKFWQTFGEMSACRTLVLPRWEGKPVPVDEAPTLLAAVRRLPAKIQATYLGRRVAAILEFVCQRRSAADLDDQVRTLADNDALALEASYSLTRFITWAIPILGFLGTVLGITGAIAGVSPERLSEDLSQVTDGLAEAFDCTALALGLTMITMFCTFLVERRESAVLEGVDRQVDRQLAHRFHRDVASAGPFVAAVQQQSQALMEAMERVVQGQAKVWADALAEPEKRAAEASARFQQQLTAAVEKALDQTLQAHANRLAALEQRTGEMAAQLVQNITGLATAVRDTGREQQAVLLRIAEGIAGQAAVLGKLQEGERHLVHLQAVLHQNLAALASASNFEQAVHSLTAAVHLLTARSAGGAGSPAPAVQMARPHAAKAA